MDRCWQPSCLLDFWFLLHPKFPHRCPPKLRKKVHNSHRLNPLRFRVPKRRPRYETRRRCIRKRPLPVRLQMELQLNETGLILTQNSVHEMPSNRSKTQPQHQIVELQKLQMPGLQNIGQKRCAINDRPLHQLRHVHSTAHWTWGKSLD